MKSKKCSNTNTIFMVFVETTRTNTHNFGLLSFLHRFLFVWSLHVRKACAFRASAWLKAMGGSVEVCGHRKYPFQEPFQVSRLPARWFLAHFRDTVEVKHCITELCFAPLEGLPLKYTKHSQKSEPSKSWPRPPIANVAPLWKLF